MQKHRAAAAGDARPGVVIDLDDEIVEMIVAPEPVAALIRTQPQRLVVVTILRVLAPGVFRADGAHGEKRGRPSMPVRPPPQLPRPECAFWRAAVAFALAGLDAAAPERNLDGLAVGGEPAPGGIAGGSANPHQAQLPAAPARPVKH
jgi:hypothetical protein